jgi:DNA polymerase-3 subunit alpha
MDYRLSRTGNAFVPKLADFSKGDADVLRKAMERSKRCLDKMKPKFISQAAAKASEDVRKIWKDWEAFAEYAFKSHSTCYAWIAYQTAYLKPIILLNIWLRYCSII